MSRTIRTGYTLIEVMVAVIILGVLCSLALPRYTSTMELFRSKEGVQILFAVFQGQLSGDVDVAEGRIASYTLGALDVVIPTLDYFNVPVLDCNGTNCPATVDINGNKPVYNHVVRSTGAYTLYIQPDGNILCTPQAVCQPMKYDPW